MKSKAALIGAVLFGAALLWGLFAIGSTPNAHFYRLFLLLSFPTLLVAWGRPLTWRSVVLLVVGLVLLGNVALKPTVTGEGYTVTAIGWMALFTTLLLAESRRDVIRNLALFLVGIGVLEALYALFQAVTGIGPTDRGYVSGTLVNRNNFAGLVVMAVAMAVGVLFATFESRRKDHARSEALAWSWIIILGTALMGVAVLMSLSRGGTITLVCTVLFLGLLLRLGKRRSEHGSASGAFAWVLLFAIVALSLWIGVDALFQRFGQIDPAEDARTIVFKDTIRMIGDSPWLGVGPRMYQWRFRPYQTANTRVWFDFTHNDYLQSAAEWGIPLAAAFWLFLAWRLGAAIRVFLKRGDPWVRGVALGAAGAIFAVLVHSLGDFDLQIPAIGAVFGVVLGLGWAAGGGNAEEEDRFADPRRAQRARIPRIGRVVAVVVLTAAVGLAATQVFRQFMAIQVAAMIGGTEGMREGMEWDPRSPDLYYYSGLMKRDRIEYADMGGAVGDLEKAFGLNPFRWDYAQELARTYELAGDDRKAREMFAKAIELNPREGLYRWRLASFHLRADGLEAALPEFKKAIEYDKQYRAPAAVMLWRSGATPEQMTAAWPPDPESQLILLKFMTEKWPDRSEMAAALWEVALKGEPVPAVTQAVFYPDYLWRSGRAAEARAEWARLVKRCVVEGAVAKPKDAGNLVWNGDFENDPQAGSMDWSLTKAREIRARVRGGQGVGTSRALVLEFDGERNPEGSMATVVVPVEPGGYRASYGIRAEKVTSDQGISLYVTDAVSGRVLGKTDGVVGSVGWTEMGVDFAADATVKAVRLSFRRNKSWKIDSLIGGTVWIDEVSVKQTGS